MSRSAVRSGRCSSPGTHPTVRARVLVAGLLAVGGLVIVPATAADAATSGCPQGRPGVGGRSFTGGPGLDVITGTPGDDYICAGAGDDIVDGGGGKDHIYGGPGADRLRGGAGADWIEGGAGSDDIHGNAGSDQIFADAGPAFEHAPVPVSAAGNDVVYGEGGSDVIEAGPGNDIVLAGGRGDSDGVGDVVHGGPGNDAIVSNPKRPSFSDSFFGDDGDDFLWPNPIRTSPLGNVVWGGAGNDLVVTANGLSDGIELGDSKGIKIPIVNTPCTVTVPFLEKNKAVGSPRALSCKIPKIGNRELEVTGGADSEVSLKGSLFGMTTSFTATSLRSILSGGFSGDVCVCDPKIPGWPVADLVH